MTSPEFSVLLLAWDDADPSVAVLGGAALPPTLPLVYQLAAQQPVVAVYPYLPADAAPAETTPAPESNSLTEPKTDATALKTKSSEAATGAFDAAVELPGVLLLPSNATTKTMTSAQPSRIISLANLAATRPASPSGPVNLPEIKAPDFSRSQWPTGENAPLSSRGGWQVPAAPYLGAETGRNFPPPPPAPPRPSALMPTAATSTGRTLTPRSHPQAGDLNFDPDPELPPVHRPAVFDEPTEEVGSAEALDLLAPEDDLVPDEPGPAAEAEAAVSAMAPEPAPAPTAEVAPVVLVPVLNGLNFRMIQYARQAAQLVRGQSDFGVIYAPNWPAWLAALEIRNSSGLPLVLYSAGLATDLPNLAERGWQLEIERMTMRRARLILVPDEAVCRRLRALYGSTIGEVRVVAAANEPGIRQVLREVAAA